MEVQMNLIYERAWSFHRTTGIDFDELVGEAMLAYAEAHNDFIEEYGVKETTYAYSVITNRLVSFCSSMQKIRFDHIEDIGKNFGFEPNFDVRINGLPMDKFPKEVKELMEIVFEYSDQLTESSSRNKGFLRRVLRQRGWPFSKIDVSFMMLKNILNQVPVNQLFS